MTQKKKRRWIRWLILVVILLIIGGAVTLCNRRVSVEQIYKNALDTSVEVIKGDIRVQVQAAGSVSPKQIDDLLSPQDGKVEEIFVAAGDFVEKGARILYLSGEQYSDEIDALEAELADLDTQIRSTHAGKSSYISSPVDGRIKEIYVEVARETEIAMNNNTGLFLLSMDERMRLEVESNEAIISGTEVIVLVDDKKIESTVLSVSENIITVVIPDDKYEIGKDAVLFLKESEKELGEGKLQVNQPYYVPGPYGEVRSIYVDLQDRVYVGTDLVRLEEPAYSFSYQNLLKKRTETVDKLSEAREKENGIEIVAEESGVIEEILVVENQVIQEKDALIKMHDGQNFELIVAVDELDIASVEIGQQVSLVFSALPAKEYQGEVRWISAQGKAEGDITSYDVAVDIFDSQGILNGMSARADILIMEKIDTILIPAQAISTKDGKKYVQIVPKPEQERRTPAQPEEIEVTVGLMNGAEAEILSGLEAGMFIFDESRQTDTGVFMFGGRG